MKHFSNKFVMLDIGTHKAQELRVLCGDRMYIFSSYLYWWFDWCKRIVKLLLGRKQNTQYGSGLYHESPVRTSFSTHKIYIKHFFSSKNYLHNFRIISIDPMAIVTEKHVRRLQKKVQIHYIPVAILPHDSLKESRIVKFYINQNSLSSSLHAKKDNNIHEVLSPAFKLDILLDELVSFGFLEKESKIVARMNCEGSEFSVINSLVSRKVDFENIFGSIFDVDKIYGTEVGVEMKRIMADNNIAFTYYKGSDPSTWSAAFGFFGKISNDL